MDIRASRRVLLGSALVVAGLAFGCDHGDEPILYGDCRDPDRSCFEPFVCEVFFEAYSCHSPYDEMPVCHGTPAGQAVPFALVTGDDIPLHWTLPEGCIPVSHRPGFAGLLPGIEGALAAWNALACSDVCFASIEVREDDPDLVRRERRVHIKSALLPDGTVTRVTLYYEAWTGRIWSAVVEVDTRWTTPPMLAEFVTVIGQVLGLDRAVPGTDSVMAGSGADAPTALDEEAVCRLYGTPTYCEN